MGDMIWVLVPLAGIWFLYQVITMGIRHEERKLELKAQARGGGEELGRMSSINADLQAEVARLKERVNVLERLVLDDDRRLSAEIDQLRRPQSPA